MKSIDIKSENWDFFILCFINLNIASISGTGNVQPVFNLGPCVIKHLQCDICWKLNVIPRDGVV